MLKKLLTIILILFSITTYCQINKEYFVNSIEIYHKVKGEYELNFIYWNKTTLVINNDFIILYDEDDNILVGYTITGIDNKSKIYKKRYTLKHDACFFISDKNEFLLIDKNQIVYKFNIKR